MGLSNYVTYDGRLECAHSSIATATLKICLEDIDDQSCDDISWLGEVLHPKTSVIFLDTSNVRVDLLKV